MEAGDVRMMLVPVKFLAVEATMPDGTVNGKSTVMAADTPGHVLAAIERGLLREVEHDFPGADVYPSAGWQDTQVPMPEEAAAAQP